MKLLLTKKWQILWRSPFVKYYNYEGENLRQDPIECEGIIWYFPTFRFSFPALRKFYRFIWMIGYLDIRRFK